MYIYAEPIRLLVVPGRFSQDAPKKCFLSVRRKGQQCVLARLLDTPLCAAEKNHCGINVDTKICPISRARPTFCSLTENQGEHHDA